MITEKEKSLNSAYETFVRLVISDGAIDQLDDFATHNTMGYGTTIDEVIHDLTELKNLARLQREQTADENFHYNSTPVFRKVMNHGKTAVFVDEVELNFVFDGKPMSFQIRLSVIMELVDGKWKAVHFHASKPEYDSGGSDPWHKEEWKQKNEELQRMVDEKTADLAGKNRELEIETALERVRTVAMGMQKPDDLLDVCRIISEQLELLNVSNIRNIQVAIINESKKNYSNYQFFAAYAKAVFEETLYEKNPAASSMVSEMRKSTNSFFIGSIKDDELQKFRYWRKKYDQFPDPLLDKSSAVYYYFYSIGEGGLGLTTYHEISSESLEIFKRFHKVFTMAYRRFMDIQQVESQAREAQIELALERIRAQVTAMQESAELLDIVVNMRTEFVALDHEAHYFWYMRWLPEKYEKAMTSGDGTRIGMVMSLPRHIHGDVKLVADWEKSDAPTLVFAMDEETAVDYVHKMIALGDFKQVDPQAPTLDDIRKLGGLTFIMARTTHGEIGFSLPGNVPDPPEDAVETLKRFAGVFDLAYKRFEDLKATERRHREAKIELALERVRARSMAMRKSDELADLSLELVKQVHALGVDTWFCAFNIYDDDPKGSLEWGSNGQGTFPQYRTPREGIFLSYYEAGQSGETFLINKIVEKACPAHYDYLCSLPGVGEQLLKMKDAGIPFPTSQIDHVAYFKYGYIIFITFEPAREAHDIFKRFARVFEQTYTRFLDLQRAEAQALQAEEDLIAIKVARQKAEEALAELKATQSQLIHAEKMASLGELTAGIAHEIQNPLNFINNFSEVNKELVDELLEEIDQGDKNEIKAIAIDIRQNEEKISHHGKRADGIVKGMLQHSRSSTGQKQPTDINALADEYLRLAYHGLRAKDKSFSADFQKNFDDSIPKIEALPQDIGRVLLNLINNAFYAVSEKNLTGLEGTNSYNPTVTVSTKNHGDRIEISVKDNGNGIPDEIKDKIFQPFFTTKPTGQGTGLGLSMSYDIITKGHGGELKVESQEGTGTEFIVRLAVNK